MCTCGEGGPAGRSAKYACMSSEQQWSVMCRSAYSASVPREREGRVMRRRLTVGALCCVLGVWVAACSQPEQRLLRDIGDRDTLLVTFNPVDTENWILAELYQTALDSGGHQAYSHDNNDSVRQGYAALIRSIREGDADVAVVCTGTALELLDPAKAKELSEKFEAQGGKNADVTSGEARDEVYAAMVASLPETVAAANPSSTEGCEDSTGEAMLDLPQNIVPIFRKHVLDHHDRQSLNKVSGTVSRADLDELDGKAVELQSVSSAIKPYIVDHDI